jgi:hypothetical protein
LGSDVVDVTGGTATFDTKDVGNSKVVTVTGLTLTGPDAGNYVLSNPTESTTANITPAPLAGSITAVSKPYDATPAATLQTLSLTGVLGSDVVSLSGGAAAFDTANVGAAKTVTATGLTLSGPDAGNYTLSNPTETTTAAITPELVITGTSGIDDLRLTADANPNFVDWFVFVAGAPSQLGLTINGLGNNDTILLNYANGNPLPNTLHLNGTFTINNLGNGGVFPNPLANTTLEIDRSTVFINYGSAGADATTKALIKTYLAGGYNGGTWTGVPTATTGVITSTPAAANVNHNTAIGWADSSDGTGVNTVANTIELKYTLNGDTNLNGTVDIFDLNALLPNFNKTGDWTGGDFNYTGNVDIFDLNALLPNFNATLGAQLAPATNVSSGSTPGQAGANLSAAAVAAATSTSSATTSESISPVTAPPTTTTATPAPGATAAVSTAAPLTPGVPVATNASPAPAPSAPVVVTTPATPAPAPALQAAVTTAVAPVTPVIVLPPAGTSTAVSAPIIPAPAAPGAPAPVQPLTVAPVVASASAPVNPVVMATAAITPTVTIHAPFTPVAYSTVESASLIPDVTTKKHVKYQMPRHHSRSRND